MSSTGRALGGAICGLLAIGAASAAAGRELHWREIAVEARLAADGSLHVTELQQMVFSGDWNGGERRFALRAGERVELVRMSRFDPATRDWRELAKGGLDAVDRWDWHDRRTLRWRSRLPSDPPFEGTEIVYRLETVYRRILQPAGEGRYRLSHDFAFTDREGPIERFSVALAFDPAWEPVGRAPATVETGVLPPGVGFVVERELVWRGEGVPAAATVPRLPRALRFGAVALVLLAALERLVWLLRRDRALGRFEPGPDPASIDRAWLDANLLSTPPEVVGAAWDRSIGSAEVAALLARLVQEGKMASEVERRSFLLFETQNLRLRLLVPRESLTVEERGVIDGLFPSGDTTDTASLRAHYRGRDFNPAEKLRKPLEARMHALAGFATAPAKPSRWPTAIAFVLGVAALAAGFAASSGAGYGALFCFLMVFLCLGGWIAAGVGQGRVGKPWGSLVFVLLVTAVISAFVFVLSGQPDVPWATLLGMTLLGVAAVRTFLHLLATRESAESMRRRRELAAARERFREELRRPVPALDDRWFPWVVAFGLAPDADRWFRSHGRSGSTGGGFTGGSSSSGGATGGGWTGGGGSFGGAGASASFAAAVGSMASGVSSGSSGGGGGGGGGGSSGGGGGGGW